MQQFTTSIDLSDELTASSERPINPIKTKRISKQNSKIQLINESTTGDVKPAPPRISKQKSEIKTNHKTKSKTEEESRPDPYGSQSSLTDPKKDEDNSLDREEDAPYLGDESDDDEEANTTLFDDESLKTVDFEVIDKSKSDLEKKRDIALKHLCSQSEMSQILENPQSRSMIKFIDKLTLKKMKLIYFILKTGYEKKMVALLDYQYEHVIKQLHEENLNSDENSEVNSKLELLRTQLRTIMALTNRSIDFSSKLTEANAIQVLFKFVTDEFLIDVITANRLE